MKPERDASLALVNTVSHERVAGSSPDALTHAVSEPYGEHASPRRDQVEKRLYDRRHRVSDDRESLPLAELVGEPSREHLEQTGRGFRDSLDRTNGGGPDSQHVEQEERQEVHDHLGRDVHEEARRRHDPDVAGKTASHVA